MLKALLLAIIVVASAALPAQAREPTFDERQRIEATLRAEGFTSWGVIEFDDQDWLVEEARNQGSTDACDVYIDPETYVITEEDCDPDGN